MRTSPRTGCFLTLARDLAQPGVLLTDSAPNRGSGLLGLYLQKRLPQTHLSGGSKEMIPAVIGLITLLLALVFDTLVGNTYAFFAMQKSELEIMASRALLVDQALAEYGPEAKPARNLMKQALTQSYDLFWAGRGRRP
jgi:hypothetical protein